MIFSIIYYIFSLISLSYFLIYTSRLGTNNKFIYFFLAIFIIFAIIGTAHLLYFLKIISIPKFIWRTFYFLFLVGFIIFMTFQGIIIYNANTTPTNDSDYILVLGARVVDKRITYNLKTRLDTAYNYYKRNKSSTIVLSGGQGKGENISEADAMANYLINKGVDSKHLLIENRSRNTNENIDFSTELIKKKDGDITSLNIVVCTNSFHLYRSKKLLEKKAFKSVQTLGSPSKLLTVPLNYTRETISVMYYLLRGRI